MATTESKVGERTLAAQVDYLAQHDPQRVWATIPRHPGDVSIGYRDITFKKLANAVDTAAGWMKSNLSGSADYETVTYSGPYDMQYPIIALAAAKCGKKLFLTSSWITPAAQTHLLRTSGTTTYMHSPYFTARVKALLAASPEIRALETPTLSNWLDCADAPPFPYEKTWDEAAKDPWMMFHTSGTTGMPKLITYTHEMFATFDAEKLMPDATDPNTMNSLFHKQRFLTGIPQCHMTGMTAALQWPIWLENVYVAPPSAGPLTARQALDVIKIGKVGGVVFSPAIVDEMCQEPDGLEILRGLEWICYAGAPISPHVAELLKDHTVLMPGIGTTEAGTYWTAVCEGEGDGWDAFKFRESNGIVMEDRGNDTFELVFHRKSELAKWQQIFWVFPDLDVFYTKDIWTRHPQHADAWCYAGRIDDMIVFRQCSKLIATDLQHMIQQAPGVRAVLIGGTGRWEPFILIDLVEPTTMTADEKEAKIDEIWPYVEQANAECVKDVQFVRDLIVFTEPSKRLPLTMKGTITRPRALDLYADEIDQVYELRETRNAMKAVAIDAKPVENAGIITVTEQPVSVQQ